ncbi:hypothetical protein S101395_03003 [Bacillus sonorensis]|uniref:Uncharacterized protein n=2 Tax=Bacillus sonorensis TaxID=119858 RepID=M5PDY6_9BACI|nr:hypothetical protein S101395_03003 [Bacillus sonorensis]EME74187.1 hypothetical protein BSONL12_10376 [Bacillus sonorensis L12]
MHQGTKILLLIIEYSLTTQYKMKGRKDGLKRVDLIITKRKLLQYFSHQALANHTQKFLLCKESGEKSRDLILTYVMNVM